MGVMLDAGTSTENGEGDAASDTEGSEKKAENDVARINMRIPRSKYDWLQEELDSFTSDTGRFQYLIQFYSDHKEQDCPSDY